MENRNNLLKKYFSKADIGGGVSINDLREKEFSRDSLTLEEKTALRNFDTYRIAELNKQLTDFDFHERYRQLQVMANLSGFEEFLKEKYIR
ncbi:MAG: hypothetical protein ABI199_03105 [Bacteroidia bacterium]